MMESRGEMNTGLMRSVASSLKNREGKVVSNDDDPSMPSSVAEDNI